MVRLHYRVVSVCELMLTDLIWIAISPKATAKRAKDPSTVVFLETPQLPYSY